MSENAEMDRLRAFIDFTATNIFLTGRAGTGKTTLLHDIVKRCPKAMIVTAPTGIAAINAHGVTIHSFFQLAPSIFNPNAPLEPQRYSKSKLRIMRSLELLVIDEISMVRSDLLDAVDAVLRRHRHSGKPFGGVQLLLIGDMQQLPPVVRPADWQIMSEHYRSPYFFDSLALKKVGYLTLELQHIYRQTDRQFIDILTQVRIGNADQRTLAAINTRYDPTYVFSPEDQTITLCSHNTYADAINARAMDALRSRPYTYIAQIEGAYKTVDPVDRELTLKVGCRVMFARNDSSHEKRYVNGTLAVVTALDEESIEVVMDGEKEPYSLHAETWETVHYDVDDQTRQYTTVVDGSFRQYPLRTAWAVTIHKSQGLTFDNVVLDATDSFDHGQVYVALSRCRTLGGIRLLRPLTSKAIFTEHTIDAFNASWDGMQASQSALDEQAELYRRDLIRSMFNLSAIETPARATLGAMREHVLALYPAIPAMWAKACEVFLTEGIDVASRFSTELEALFALGTENNARLAERIRKGAAYFLQITQKSIFDAFQQSISADIELDSRQNRKIIETRLEALGTSLSIQMAIWEWAAENEFSTIDMLTVRSQAAASDVEVKKSRKKSAKKTKGGVVSEPDPDKELTERLREWRREKSAELGAPAYMILSQGGLLGIAASRPTTLEELSSISGIGPVFMKKYADEVLELIATK